MKPSVKPSIKAMKHQLISLAHDEKHDVVYDTSEPGTGKTFVRIAGYAKRRKKLGHKLLVLAPRSLLKSVWFNDFKKFAPDIKVSLAYADKRDAAFAPGFDVYVTNHDAVKWLVKKPDGWFRKMGFGELAVDEITAYKHATSQRSKAVKKIAKHFKFRKGMTGTPNTVSITDVWHQMFILDGGQRLGGSFFAFRNACCTSEQVGYNVHAQKWHDKPGIEEVVFDQISDVTIRHKLDDCADIPPNHHYSVEFEMPAKMRRVYDDMASAQILQLDKHKITAVNASAVQNKLLQISSGAVYTGVEDGDYKIIDTGRYEFVLDLVEARKHPLVFFLWKHQRDMLMAEADKRKLTYDVIDGGTSDQARHESEQRYQNGLLDFLLAHPKTVAHGFTLTRGTSTIWCSPTRNLEWYDQGSRRQRRIGQKHKTETITVLAADNEVEQLTYDDLQRKDGQMGAFLGLLHTWTKEKSHASRSQTAVA